MLCLAAGIALLAWRVLEPGDSALVPPGMFDTPESTPTPGLWGTPLPAPDPDLSQLVLLPVSELPTRPTLPPSLTATRTPSATPSATLMLPPTPVLRISPTRRPTAYAATADLVPSASPTASPLPTAALSASPSPTRTPPPPASPTVTPSPTHTPRAPVVPQRIVIEAIGLDAPVVPVGQHVIALDGTWYGQWDVPNRRAAGWHESSASLGQPGNTVINGHHNTSGEVFRYLVALKPGDRITLQSAARAYHYIVVQTMTLAEEGQPVETRRENARWILPTRDERVTLITCWPYSANTHRLVVIAIPIKQIIPPAEIP